MRDDVINASGGSRLDGGTNSQLARQINGLIDNCGRNVRIAQFSRVVDLEHGAPAQRLARISLDGCGRAGASKALTCTFDQLAT
jgi:hypothetical protein